MQHIMDTQVPIILLNLLSEMPETHHTVLDDEHEINHDLDMIIEQVTHDLDMKNQKIFILSNDNQHYIKM